MVLDPAAPEPPLGANRDARSLSRRRFLTLASGTIAVAAGASVLAAPRALGAPDVPAIGRVGPSQAISSFELTAGEVTLDLAGRAVTTWGYNGAVPGPLVRLRAGETLRAAVTNGLSERTTVHWHGIRLANDMDGVPDITQSPIPPSGRFDYEFVTPDPGTYFFHPHVGLQLDHGLYAPLIVDDPNEPGDYDAEWILVLDDWTDGIGPIPDTIFSQLRQGMTGMGNEGDSGHGMDHSSGGEMDMNMANTMNSAALGGHAGDVEYPLFLINGRAPKDPETFTAEAGQRLRLRIINAGSDTAFRFAIGGHRLTVTHADGFPVTPTEASCVLLGMGERIDAIVTVNAGAVPVVARAEGKGDDARAVLRGGTTGRAPGRTARVHELSRRPLTVHDLQATPAVGLNPRTPDRRHRLVLDGDHMSYRWTINGRVFDHLDFDALPIADGERVRLVFDNRSTMWHPMHLHGHTFGLTSADGGARKDTVIVRPGERISVDFDAANPGTWMVHCHNAYHQEAGMMAALEYR